MTFEKLKVVFSVSIYYYEGRPVMQLRRMIKDKKLMKQIADRLDKNGKFQIDGEIKVRNPISAQIRFKEAGLI